MNEREREREGEEGESERGRENGGWEKKKNVESVLACAGMQSSDTYV